MAIQKKNKTVVKSYSNCQYSEGVA